MLETLSQFLERADLNTVPAPLRTGLQQRLESLVNTTEIALRTHSANHWHQLVTVVACSEFVTHQLLRFPELLALMGDIPETLDSSVARWQREVADTCAAAPDENALGTALRHYRNREMAAIAWRDINGDVPLETTLQQLSRLAEILIQQSLERLQQWQESESGVPVDSDNQPMALVVIGMGKLGAHELNFSSDVDLIFAFREEGETRDGPRAMANSQFFIRLGQRLINVLHSVTGDGFVYRVDMRLRPFGDSGPLAASLGALEGYYHTHGREWERYAMIKARTITGSADDQAAVMALLRSFCYRRYLDYGVFKSLREMKQLIIQEVARKDLHHNVKLGAGGIREIEFIGQVFQLIRGGREPRLRTREILKVLPLLTELGLLPEYVCTELRNAYVFMRNTEHRIQAYQDKQTHNLPRDEEGHCRLAFAMGYATWEEFKKVLDRYQRIVREHFDQVVATPQTEADNSPPDALLTLWHEKLDSDAATAELAQLGYQRVADTLHHIHNLRRARYRTLSTEGRARLDNLMPFLIRAAAVTEQPDTTLARLLILVDTVARRTVYLALLVEHPLALSQLVKLCAGSPWIADLLTRLPILLDELLDPRTLYNPPFRDALRVELAQRLLTVAPDDLEEQMEILRQFKQANVLRVAAADLMEALPLMKVSDHLTWIAEVVLEATLNLAWQELVQRHGKPPATPLSTDTGFIIIGYGKVGGLELGYGSDLDLVFLYAHEQAETATNGRKPLASSVFYTRMGQRIIHLLSTLTPAGVLYEVDMRLRPSGASGLLVSNIHSYINYEEHKAWTWEHQALVRARVIAGDPALAEAFANARRQILCQARDAATLRADVVDMREKMRSSLDKSSEGLFDIKQSPGGMVDIEFLVQYCVLAHAHQYPDLTDWPDNIRILETLERRQLLPAADVALLSDAYRTLRDRAHKLTLQDQPTIVPTAEFNLIAANVLRVWHALLGT